MQAIRAHKDSHKQYTERLLAEGSIKQEQLDQINGNVLGILQKAFEEAKASPPHLLLHTFLISGKRLEQTAFN